MRADSTIAALSRPFDEAVAYFRDKINLPTEHWDDLWEGMHSRGFVVAGAAKADLLADLRVAVDKAIAKGTSLEAFRKDFDDLVARHGWSYRGKRGWRTRIIWETNIRTAYSAGRFRQMTDPEMIRIRPWWVYLHGDSMFPRLEHLAWHNTVLPHDDPWWDTHYTPNGWGCKCRIRAMADRDLERLGLKPRRRAPKNGTYIWEDRTGKQHEIPTGIDPGWAYNPGRTAWGRQMSEEVQRHWQAEQNKAWEVLTPGDRISHGLGHIEADLPRADRDFRIPETEEGIRTAVIAQLGGEEAVLSFDTGTFRYDILANAASLAAHIKPNRAPMIPFLREAIEDPQEIWMSFERHRGTGKVVLRQRMIKVLRMEKQRSVIFVVNAMKGMLEGWTFFPSSSRKYVDSRRYGQLIWKRE